MNLQKITTLTRNEISYKLLLLFFFIFIFVLRIYYFNYFSVPDSDFFDLRNKAIQLINLNLPESYQRLPLYSFLSGLLSTILPGREPILFAAELINLIAFLTSSILLYFISKRFLGKAAFIVLYLFALHPLSIYMTSQPRAELLTVMFVLLGIYLAHRARKAPYLAGFFASLTRYEGFFLIPSLALRDFLFSKRRLFFIVLSLLSCAGIIIWVGLNYQATGHINPYYQYFAPDTKPAGFDYIRVTMLTLLNFIQFRVTSFIPLAFVTAVVLILMTIGFWSFFSESLEDVLPLFCFFLSCSLFNVVFFSPIPQHAYVSIWVFFLGIIGGLQYLDSLMGMKLHALLSKSACPTDKMITIVFYIVILFFSLLLLKKIGFLLLLPASKIFFLTSAAIGIWFIFNSISTKTWVGLFATGVLVLCLVFISSENIKATQSKINRTKYTKAELRLTGEWYSKNVREGEGLVVSEPWVVSYYVDQTTPNSLICLGSLEAESHMAFVKEIKKKGIRYVVWDSHHGRQNKDSYYYKKYKMYLLSELAGGKDTEHFRLIQTLREGRSYAYIFELI